MVYYIEFDKFLCWKKQKCTAQAGEKKREQQIAESDDHLSNSAKLESGSKSQDLPTQIKNPFLVSIYKEMLTHYRRFLISCETGHLQSSPANQIDGYMMFLFAIVVRDLRRQGGGPLELTHSQAGESVGIPSAHDLFLFSLHLNPWNWYAAIVP